jgi:hypothetical protein
MQCLVVRRGGISDIRKAAISDRVPRRRGDFSTELTERLRRMWGRETQDPCATPARGAPGDQRLRGEKTQGFHHGVSGGLRRMWGRETQDPRATPARGAPGLAVPRVEMWRTWGTAVLCSHAEKQTPRGRPEGRAIGRLEEGKHGNWKRLCRGTEAGKMRPSWLVEFTCGRGTFSGQFAFQSMTGRVDPYRVEPERVTGEWG